MDFIEEKKGFFDLRNTFRIELLKVILLHQLQKLF